MSTAQTDENEHIDVREWLPQPVELEYPHRMNKADITRNGGTFRAAASMAPIDLLYERGVINDDQHRAAVFVMTLRRVINNSLGVDRIVQEYFRDPAAPASTNQIPLSLILREAMQGMKPYQANLIHRLTSIPRGDYDRESRPMTYQDAGWLSLCALSAREALDLLKTNIDLFYEKVKNANREGATSAT